MSLVNKIDKLKIFFFNFKFHFYILLSFNKQDLENEKRETELAEKKAQKIKLFGLLDSFQSRQEKEVSGALEFSLSNVFKCMCCTNEKPNSITDQYIKIGETLNGLKKKIDDIER